jgi:hypothetical protein
MQLTRELKGFIIGVICGCLTQAAYAVFTSTLTTDQLGSHLIRLINRGQVSGVYTQAEQEAFMSMFIKEAPDYITNGAFDTQANRLIAVRDMVRLMWQTQTGLDPTTGTATPHVGNRGRYIHHFLEDKLGLSTTTVNAVEGES